VILLLGVPCIDTAGKYDVKVTAVHGTISRENTKGVIIEMVTKDGQTISEWIWPKNTVSSRAFISNLTHAAGIFSKGLDHFNSEDLVGRYLNISVEIEDYNGKQRPIVTSWNPCSEPFTEE
jgi:hypothetical protein